METGKKEVIYVKVHTTKDRLILWNGPIGLTDKEMDVLAALIDTPGEVCGTENRKLACVQLNMSPGVLNTYIKRLRKKNAIRSEKGTHTLNRLFHERDRLEIVILGNG